MKLSNIFIKTLYDHRLSVVFWWIGIFLMLVMYVSLFPSMTEQADLAQVFGSMPEAFQNVFGDLSLIATPEGYLNTELFTLTLPLIFAIVFITLGSGLIIKEEESGTIELLLSRPISRRRIFLEKLAAMLVIVGIISSSVLTGLLAGMALVEFPINVFNFIFALKNSYFLSLVFGMIAFALAAITPRRGMSIGVAATLFILSNVIAGFAGAVDFFNSIKFLSPFYYYQTQEVLFNGVRWFDLIILTTTSFALAVIGLVSFNRRDVGG